MINVQVGEENALDATRDTGEDLGRAFSYMHLTERHELTKQPRNTMTAGIGQQLLRHARIDQVGPELRVSHDVDKDMDRLRAVGQLCRLRSGALQIQQTRERNRPIGTIDRLDLDRTGYVDDRFERLEARGPPQLGLKHRMITEAATLA